MSGGSFTIACHDCGGTYTLDSEGPEDHATDCPVRKAKIRMGSWRDPDQ